MSYANAAIKASTGVLLSAMPHLEQAGIELREVHITGRKPRIVIEPPHADSFITGAMRRRETICGVTRTLMAAPFHGCQIEWEASGDAANSTAVINR